MTQKLYQLRVVQPGSQSGTPICRDCAYARPATEFFFVSRWKWEFAKCGRQTRGMFTEALVTGRGGTTYCTTERKCWYPLDTCGPEGKYFVPKQPSGWREWLRRIARKAGRG